MSDPREERTSVVRSKLLNIMTEGMRGGPTPRVNRDESGVRPLPPRPGGGGPSIPVIEHSTGDFNSWDSAPGTPYDPAADLNQNQPERGSPHSHPPRPPSPARGYGMCFPVARLFRNTYSTLTLDP